MSVRNLALWTRVMGLDPCKKTVQRGIPCCSGKKEALLDVVCALCGYVQCVGVVLCVWLCVCVAHTFKITVYIYIQMYMSASLFLLFDLPQWFHGLLLLASCCKHFSRFQATPLFINLAGLEVSKDT